jgi:hypothetical protein
MAVEGLVIISDVSNVSGVPDVSDIDERVDGLVGGLPVKEVHRRALRARRVLGRAQGALLFWILEIDERKLYRELGCSSTYHYASRHLDLEPHSVAEAIRTGKALAGLPLLAEAYKTGELSPSKAREITRVASIETQEFWLQAARSCTTRDIEKMVAFTPKRGLPPIEARMKGQASVRVAQARGASEGGSEDPAATKHSAAIRSVLTTAGDSASAAEAASEVIIDSREAQEGSNRPTWDWKTGLNTGEDKISERVDARAAIPNTVPATSVDAPIKYHEKMFIDLTAEEMVIISDALAKARKESGLKGRAALLTFIAWKFLDGACAESPSHSRPPYQIVIHHNPLSNISWVETPQGARVVPPSIFEKASCDADIVDLEDESEDATMSEEEGNSVGEGTHVQSELNTESPTDVSGKGRGNPQVEASKPFGFKTIDEINAAYQFVKAVHARNKPQQQEEHSHSCDDECKKHRPPRNKGLRSTISPTLRRKVINRDGGRCRTCGSTYFLEIHHIVPPECGGLNILPNLCLICRSCHDLVHLGKLSLDGVIQQLQTPPTPAPAGTGHSRTRKGRSGTRE